MSDTSRTYNRRLISLNNRLLYLDNRIEKCRNQGITPHYDLAEFSAIQFAIDMIETYEELAKEMIKKEKTNND